MKSANSAMKTNGTRMANGSTGNCRARPPQRRGTLANSGGTTVAAEARVSSMIETMAHLLGQADAWIDVGVEKVDDQIDQYDHDPGLHDDPLHEWKITLEDPLVKQSADPGPGKDYLDDNRRIDHYDEIDAGQGQHRDHRVLEGVHGQHNVARQAFQPRQLDIFAAQYFEHARAGQPQQRGGEIPAERQRGHDQMLPAALAARRQPMQPHRKYQDHHQPQPEAGHGQAEQCNGFAEIVPEAVDPDGRDDAGRYADKEGDQRRRQRQFQ